MTRTIRLRWNAIHRLLPGAGALMADRIVRAGLELTVGLWMARFLGPVGFGDLSFALALVALMGPLTSMGLQGLLVREFIARPRDTGRILGSAVSLRLIGSAAAVAGVLAVALLIADPTRATLTRILSLLIPLQVVEVLDLYLQAHSRMRASAFSRSGAAILASGSRIALILAAAGVLSFAWTFVAEALIWGIALVFAARQAGLAFGSWRASAPETRGLLSESWPLIISGFGAMLNLKIDQVMLGAMASPTELGTYSAAARLSEAIYFVPHVLVAAAFPGVVRAMREDRRDYATRLDQLFRVLLGLAAASVLAGLLMGPVVIPMLLGPSFEPSVPVFRIHIWATLAVFPGALMSRWLIAEELTPFSTLRHAGGAAINIALNALLIPLYGGIGSAWATLASYVAASYLMFFIGPRTRPAAIMLSRAVLWFPLTLIGWVRRTAR